MEDYFSFFENFKDMKDMFKENLFEEKTTEDSSINIDYLEELKQENLNKYVKVIYQSEPIGEYGIILELTTFDLEAFKKDEELKKKKQFEKINIKQFQLDNNLIADGILGPQTLSILEQRLNDRVDEFYKTELMKMKNTIEKFNKQCKGNFGDVTNSRDIVCDIIEGDVINCQNVRCKEIKGDTINCSIRKELE
jgi:hypothetical protein